MDTQKILDQFDFLVDEYQENQDDDSLLSSYLSSAVPDIMEPEDLEVGALYTSEELRSVFNHSVQQGISESSDHKYIILTSSYQRQDQFNDRYDPTSGIYIFNGVGNKTNTNSRFYTKLLNATRDHKIVLLFVTTKDFLHTETDEEGNKVENYKTSNVYIYCGEMVVISKTQEDIMPESQGELPIIKLVPQDKESFDQAYMHAETLKKKRVVKKKEDAEKKKREAMFKKMNADFFAKADAENREFERDSRRSSRRYR